MKKIVLLMSLLALVVGCQCNGNNSGEIVEVDQPLDTLAAVQAAKSLPEEPVFDIVTSMGVIKVRLFKDTPRHRDNFEKLALAGYYDSLLFHRTIPGFMIQGGDPDGTGMGGVFRPGWPRLYPTRRDSECRW